MSLVAGVIHFQDTAHPMNRTALHPAIFWLMGIRPIDIQDDRRLESKGSVTIDAFDTLITRSVFRPIDVFSICGIALRERSMIRVEPSAWRDLRHHAESEIARRHHPREVRLEEIYDELVRINAILAPDKDAACETERDVERSLSRPIAATIQAVNTRVSRSGTSIVLSDTYLSSETVSELLQQAGLNLPRSAVLTSSDSGNTKRSGALFRAVRPRLAGNTETPVHVGDNFVADVRQARRAGMHVAPYVAGAPSRYEKRLFQSLEAPGLLGTVIAGSARATRLGRRLASAHEQAIWDLSANVTGPLLFAFVAWTLREAISRGLRTLYFLSRDGEILLRIAQELQPSLPVPIECRYLYVSRQSVHLPGVCQLGAPEREWVLDNATHNSLVYFLARLDIEIDEFVPALPAASPLRLVDPHRRMTPEDVAAMTDALDCEAVQALILERAARRRAICLDYMKGEGLLAPGPIGIVDIGWKGRLQRSLCRAAETLEPDFANRLHGFYIDLDRRPADAGSLATFSALCPTDRFSWASRGPLFEIFCAAHHGTVKRYRRAGGTVVPVLASESNPEAEEWGLTVQQDAVVAFAREAVHGLGLARLDPLLHVEPMAYAALEVVRTFVGRPSRAEAEAFGQFTHSYDEQHSTVEQMAGRVDFRPHALLKRLGPAYRWRRISHWPEGSVVRSLPDWLRGPALSLLHAMPGRRA